MLEEGRCLWRAAPQAKVQASDAWPGGKPAVVKRAEDKIKVFTAIILDVGNLGGGQAEGSEKKTPRQEKRAEASKGAKAKEKDGK